ncbi:MAG: aldehyde dehydrogenase family protein [Chthonomonadales bacterium]
MAHEARYANYIGGRRAPPASGLYLIDINPADAADVIGEFPNSSADDAARAVEAAQSAFRAWAGLPPGARSDFLRRAAAILEQRATEVARDLVREQGKPPRYAKAEVLAASAILRHSADLGMLATGQVLPQSDGSALAFTQRLPVGPCAVVSSWLDPIAGPLRQAAPALALGNTVVLNPSEWTPQAAWNILQCFEEAGIPAGVFNVVFGEPTMAGRSLGTHADTAAVAFQGSPRTAAAMLQWCTAPGRRLHLETHGWSALLVAAGGDVERAARDAVHGAFACAGQRWDRVALALVHASRYPEFLERVKTAVRTLAVGMGDDGRAEVGPLIGREARDRVIAWIAKARRSGAELVAGGEPLGDERLAKGCFMAPAVLAARDLGHLHLEPDLLGPALVVASFDDADEGLAALNGLEGCRAASLYPRDVDGALALADEMRLQSVAINGPARSPHCEPSFSYSFDAEAVAAYTRVRTISFAAPAVS